jgi:hypothetical protein
MMAQAAVKDNKKPLKILFFMGHPGYARNFESMLVLLGKRGHTVFCCFDRSKTKKADETEIIDRIGKQYPNVTYRPAPQRRDSEWAALGRFLRLTIDYLRYLEPRYREAPKLRQRAASRVPDSVQRMLAWPLVRSPVLIRMLKRLLQWIERAIPPDGAAVEFIKTQEPDLVLVTPLVELGSTQADYIRAAKLLGKPSAFCVFSWDNLTNKGLLRDTPDLVTVWNEMQRSEAVELHRVPSANVEVTGASAYDHWFEWSARTTHKEFCENVGLPAERPLLLYLCSSPWIAPDEAEFVRRWVREIRKLGGKVLRSASILIRPHPLAGPEWTDLDLSGLGTVVVWPRGGVNPTNEDARADYYDSLYHSQAVVGLNTSAQIEAAVVGREVFTVLLPEYRETQEGTLHFRYLVEVNGGLLNIAESMDEHARQLVEALTGRTAPDERRRRFLEAFVRPHGLGVEATPLLIEAIEERGDRGDVEPSRVRLSQRLLRRMLAPLARMTHERARRRKGGGARPTKDRAAGWLRRTRAAKVTPARDPVQDARAVLSAVNGSANFFEETKILVADALDSGRPIVAGPWSSEVGFELLYWIPFLRWAVGLRSGTADRLVVLSRGGVAPWYSGIYSLYAEIFESTSPQDFLRSKLSEGPASPLTGRPKQKQLEISAFDRELIGRARRSLDLDEPAILHPSMIYSLYKRLAKERAVGRIEEISMYEQVPRLGLGEFEPVLPNEYVAVRFYFRPSFPDTQENRRAIDSIVHSIAETTNVVLLNTGIELDDHLDFYPEDSERIFRVDHLLRPSDNLAVQTRIMSHAQAFIGTYGGLAYLAPFVGVPSLAFYSNPEKIHRAHLQLAQSIFDEPGWGDLVVLDIRSTSLLGYLTTALSPNSGALPGYIPTPGGPRPSEPGRVGAR